MAALFEEPRRSVYAFQAGELKLLYEPACDCGLQHLPLPAYRMWNWHVLTLLVLQAGWHRHEQKRVDRHGKDKRYVRRNAKGQFAESDDVGRSLSQEVRKAAKKKVTPGHGDRGDRKR